MTKELSLRHDVVPLGVELQDALTIEVQRFLLNSYFILLDDIYIQLGQNSTSGVPFRIVLIHAFTDLKDAQSIPSAQPLILVGRRGWALCSGAMFFRVPVASLRINGCAELPSLLPQLRNLHS
jgi:hypothetical protein